MDLNTVWFLIISFLFGGYFVLEGFDFGVCILLPYLGKSDLKRRVLLNTIGPHWDGNEVWLISAGGAIFAAFPEWYATLFSGFYLPLFLILIALIIRGAALEFRSKSQKPGWRSFWDWALFGGSIVPAFLWGVAFSNFGRGVPLDVHLQYVGGFWNLLNGYALLGGVVSVLLFTLHGAVFLSIKVAGELQEEAQKATGKLWLPVLVALGGFVIASYSSTDFMHNGRNLAIVILMLALTMLIGWQVRTKKSGRVFVFSTLLVLLFALFFMVGLYPRLLVSNTNPDWSLTIYNAAAGDYSLRLMTIIAAIFLPVMLLYTAWTFRVFRNRISDKPKAEDLIY